MHSSAILGARKKLVLFRITRTRIKYPSKKKKEIKKRSTRVFDTGLNGSS